MEFEFIPSSEVKTKIMSEIRFLLIRPNYWVSDFQFVESTLFGQVRRGVIRALSKYFFRTEMARPLEKNGP